MPTNYNRIKKNAKSAKNDISIDKTDEPVEPVESEQPQAKSEPKIGLVVAKNGLCLREAPSKESDIFRVLLYNTNVTVFDEYVNDEWVRVMAEDGEIGYCMTEFIDVK